MLGLDSLDEMFTVNIAGVDIVGLSGLIDYIKGQLTDDNDDWWIKNVWLPLLKKWKLDGYDIDISAFWEKSTVKLKISMVQAVAETQKQGPAQLEIFHRVYMRHL